MSNKNAGDDLITIAPGFAALTGAAAVYDDSRKAKLENNLMTLTRSKGNVSRLKDWQIEDLIRARNAQIVPKGLKAGAATGGVLIGAGLTVKGVNKALEKKAKEMTEKEKKDLAVGGGLVAGGTGAAARQVIKHEKSKVKLDPKSKNIAIVYPGGKVGQGHKQPSEALRDFYKKQGYNVDMFDVQEYQYDLAKKHITDQYGSAVSKNPVENMPSGTIHDPDVAAGLRQSIPDKIKSYRGKNQDFTDSNAFKYLWNKVPGHDRAVKDIRKKDYSRIIATHGMSGDILRNTGAPVDVVVTDFVQDPFAWKTDSAGKYYVPTEAARRRFIDTGVDPKKIVKTDSLIVKDKFKKPETLKEPEDIAKVRKTLSASKGKKTPKIITIAGGGEGIQVDEIAKGVSKHYQAKDPEARIFAVTGKNKDAAKNLQKLKDAGELPNVEIKGFVKDLGERFRHSDLVVTRPGGSTTAELLHTGTPVVTYTHADVAKKWSDVGSHEHGNVKVLADKGMSRHFQTKHKESTKPPKGAKGKLTSKKSVEPAITNYDDLSKVLDDVGNNFEDMVAKAQKTSKEFVKTNPEKQIFDEAPGVVQKAKMGLGKRLGIVAGLGVAGLGAKKLVDDNFKTKKAELELSDKQKNIAIGAGVATGGVWGLGAAASRGIPGMRGGKGIVAGPFVAAKKLMVDFPKDLLVKKKSMDEATFNLVGLEGKIKRIKLTPSEIIARSEKKLKDELGEKAYSSLNPIKKRKQSKQYDNLSAKNILKEQEDLARKEGYDGLAGISHFTPATASRMGYKESDVITDKGMQRIMGENKKSPLNYYRTEKNKSFDKLKTEGMKNLTPDDAYWLSAPTDALRLFHKDLKKSPMDNVKAAITKDKGMSAERKVFLNNREKDFKRAYDNLVETIAKEKS